MARRRTMIPWTRGLAGASLMALLAGCVASPAPQQATTPAASAPKAATEAATRWKVLLVAADDAEPVFDNGVDALKAKLEGFGVPAADVAVLKADAPRAEAAASQANFDREAARLAGPAGTGCFVYITSHGARGYGLVASRDEAVIPPAYLAQVLAAPCTGRPTVLVLSGCYSGIYTDTPALATPDRIVLAAARADRPSFGCGADDRYTYYDECFLGALQQGAAWTAIAVGTAACVARREQSEGFPASAPQAAIGRNAATLTAF